MEEKKLTEFLEKIRNINVTTVEPPKQETNTEGGIGPDHAVSAYAAGTTTTLSAGSNLLLGSLVIGSNTAVPDFCVAGFLWGANFAAIGQLNLNGLLEPLGLTQSQVTDCYINLNGGSGHTLYLYGNGNYYKALPVSSGSTRIPIWEIYQATGSLEFMLQSDGQPTSFTADGSTVEITYTGMAKTLTGLVISNPPDRTAYVEGEVFRRDGMVVTAQFSNGSVAVLSGREYTISPSNILNASNTYITVSYRYGQTIKTATQTISVLGLTNVAYGSHALQKMDIRLPLSPSTPVPAVITIHGGNWSGGDKSYYTDDYKYMSDLIINRGLAHVSINYRLMNENGGLPSNSSNAPYKHMLDDIKSVLQKLRSDYLTYIDTSNCALAGHSAGGHLALLYAYDPAYNNITNTDRSYVKLVVSEAGPTDLVSSFAQSAANSKMELASLVGKNINTVTEYDLKQASPIEYANASSVKTVLAYGTNIYVDGILTDSDGIVPISQAEALRRKINGSDNNTVNCSLYVLYGLHHNSFNEVLSSGNYREYFDALYAAINSL